MGKRKLSEPYYDSDGQEIFHVEVITRARVAENKKYEYRVKWAGYGSGEDSWEPYGNVEGCTRLLNSFWKEVGIEKKSRPAAIGQELTPSSEWIKKERERFSREYDELEEKKAKKRQKRREEKENKRRKREREHDATKLAVKGSHRTSSSKLPVKGADAQELDSEQSDDVPLMNSQNSKSSLKGKAKISTQPGASDTTKSAASDPKGKGKVTSSTADVDVQDGPSPHSLFDDLIDKPSEQTPTTPDRPTSPMDPEKSNSSDSLFGSSPEQPVKATDVPCVPDVAKPKSDPKALPAHVQRKINPLVKMAPAPLIRNVSALSTKQKITGEVIGGQPQPVKNKFSGMKIPKKPLPAVPLSQTQSEASHIVDHTPEGHMESHTSENNAGPSFGNRRVNSLQERRPSIASPTEPSASNRVVSDNDVENLLASIAPLSAVAAQKADVLREPNAEKKQQTIPVKQLKFEKKWKWTGELFVDIGVQKAERLCEVSVDEPSEHVTNGFRLNMIFNDMDSIRLTKVYTKPELSVILEGLRRVDQCAKVSEHKEADKEAFQNFVNYLERGQLVTCSPVVTIHGQVAEFIVFPSSNTTMCSRLEVPPFLCNTGNLVIALLPWRVSPTIYNETRLRSSGKTMLPIGMDNQTEILHANTKSRYDYQMALDHLRLPEELVTFMPRRPYCVWATPIETKPTNHGCTFAPNLQRDTEALLKVMKELQAENRGYKTDIRVVFVHVGALCDMIRNLPAIMERRMRRPEIQFWTYGSHESVEPARWGSREIFPVGGIVTFTPSALLEDPWGIELLIGKIHQHPLWDCYVLPSVLGLFAKSACLGDDPMAVFDENPFLLGSILALIEEGRLALLRTPPLNRHSTRDEFSAWIDWQLSLLHKKPREILEDILGEFSAGHANKSESQARDVIELEIVASLRAMQVQPVIADRYRRFVVIKSSQDSHIPLDKDSVEWRTLEDFDFRDDFFMK
ncbi:hypothetical protein BD410DRAFT_781374 [Rickenella mellea]|uniref:Chromo domain-containing protein n=1 Tax=Rickenella mellea TaxID=50990 RepID=A0A4Y7QME9_9AGAM|nr:hypothetical protein BD410DRAFT_781374 [Rickenella mellea]